MPDYAGIHVELCSQFDPNPHPEYRARIEQKQPKTLPEYAPAVSDSTTFESEDGKFNAEKEFNEETRTFSYFVPSFPCSQFWISYTIDQPSDLLAIGYFFKLCIDGKFVVAWGCGEEEGWKGKTMFALYEQEGFDGKMTVEKRAFFFPENLKRPQDTLPHVVSREQACIEVRVYRIKARKRIQRQLADFVKHQVGKTNGGVELMHSGTATGQHPKRFWKFALMDATDEPYFTIRYHYRTSDDLEWLNYKHQSDEENEAPVVTMVSRRALEGGYDEEAKMIVSSDGGDGTFESSFSIGSSPPPPQTGAVNSAECTVPHEDSMIFEGVGEEVLESAPTRFSRMRPAKRLKRLSVPPSVTLQPPPPPDKPLPSIPTKIETTSPFSYRPHPAYPLEDWEERTPSPISFLRQSISTPPLSSWKKGESAGPKVIKAVFNMFKMRSKALGDNAEGG